MLSLEYCSCNKCRINLGLSTKKVYSMPEIKKGLGPFIVFLIKFGDFIILNVLLVITYYVFKDYLVKDIHENLKTILLVVNLCYGISLSFFGVKLADRVVGIEQIVRNAFYIIVLHFILINACFTILNIVGVSRWAILLYSVTMCAALIIWRVSMRIFLKNYRKKGGNFINVVIVGVGGTAKFIYDEMRTELSSGFRILGFFSGTNEVVPDNLPAPYLGTCEELMEYEETRIDEVYYTLPITTGVHFRPIANFCKMNMIRFFVAPDFTHVLKRKIDLVFLDNIPLFKISEEPLAKKSNRFIKRTLDIVFSIGVMILTYPFLFLIIAPIIKLTSPGPVLFKQERTGLKGGNFICYKFRSMTTNSEANKKQATKGDARITKIGAFLRKTSLDEMPQFINVIKGDMSVVGPRPHMKAHTEMYSQLIDRYMFRHIVKPGITGWAQVSGYRGETKTLEQMEGRIERDVWYIENYSILLDIKIILRTVWNAIAGDEQAY